MPSEDTPVIKRGSADAASFWSRFRDEQNSVTESLRVVNNDHKPSCVFSLEERATWNLPFQRQQRPFIVTGTEPTLPTPPLQPHHHFSRTSRSIEREVFRRELMQADACISTHVKQVARQKQQNTQLLTINRALANYMSKMDSV